MASYNELKLSDITRRGRDPIVIDKIKNAKGFLVKKGEFYVDKNSKAAEELVSQIVNPPKGYKVTLPGKLNGRNANLVFPNDFLKDASLGGKGAGSGTAAEDAALTKFRIEIEKAIEKENEAEIKINVGGRTVEICGIESTPGVPKADFHFVNSMGQEVAWLSHKAGSKPQHFQQYGGLSDRSFSNNSEVKQFMTDIIDMFPEGLSSGQSVYRICKNKDLIMKSVYGIDFGKSRGRNNVDEFHQGDMKLVKSGSVYKIKSTHSGRNGSPLVGAGYEPVFFARYTTDRGANIAGKFLSKARVGIFPKAKTVSTTKEI